MRKTTWYCDRCGKLIERTAHVLAVHYYDPDGSRDEEEGAELCKDCYNVVDKAIADLIRPPKKKEEPNKAQKQHGGQNKARLDLGKIAALRNAGWSFDAIGYEMGVTGSTIRNHIDEAMEFLANKQKEEENE